MYDDDFKAEMVDEIRATFFRDYKVPDHRASCLHWAGATRKVLTEALDRRILIQGGSAFFRCVPKDRDEDVIATHFGYQFDPNSGMSHAMVMMNMLPEMHVWCADIEAQQIIDVTTVYQPSRYEEMTGEKWSGSIPDFVWGGEEVVRAGDMRYLPDVSACYLAEVVLKLSPLGVGMEKPTGFLHEKWMAIRRMVDQLGSQNGGANGAG